MVAHHSAFRQTYGTIPRQGRQLPLFGPKPSPGFTLIELLVVVGVIAILLAIMLPSLRRAKETARRVVCTSHLRQMQIAWYTYAEDHDGFIVCGNAAHFDRPHGKPWMIDGDSMIAYSRAGAETMMRTGALASYVGDVSVYYCPSQYKISNVGKWSQWCRWMSGYGIVSSMNCMEPSLRASWESDFNGARSPSPIRTCITKLSQLHPSGPARRMVFLDVGCPMPSHGFSADYYITGLSPMIARVWAYTSHGPPIHHSKGTTASFADGSVQHWKWKDPRTIALSQAWLEYFEQGETAALPADHPPEPFNWDYIEFHKAIWGRL